MTISLGMKSLRLPVLSFHILGIWRKFNACNDLVTEGGKAKLVAVVSRNREWQQ